jgi:hypothetical protein
MNEGAGTPVGGEAQPHTGVCLARALQNANQKQRPLFYLLETIELILGVPPPSALGKTFSSGFGSNCVQAIGTWRFTRS